MKKLISITFLALFTLSANAGLIFEDDFGTGGNSTVGTGTTVGNWLVSSGNVDFWNFDGPLVGRSVDLGGTNANGTIQTTAMFSFEQSTTYELSFLLGNNTNPNGNNGIIFGLFGFADFTQEIADISALSASTLQEVTYTFTADSDFDASIFFTTTGQVDNSGAIVDNVALNSTEVPEPASLGLFGLALLAMRRLSRA